MVFIHPASAKELADITEETGARDTAEIAAGLAALLPTSDLAPRIYSTLHTIARRAGGRVLPIPTQGAAP